MPIAFACPDCGKKYRVNEKMAGKTAKCQGCGKTIKVPSPKATSAAAAKPAPKAEAPKPAKEAAPDGKEFGLAGIESEGDFFEGASAAQRGNPLGEQVIEDYGFAAVEVKESPKESSSSGNEFSANPLMQEIQQATAPVAVASEPAKKKGNLFLSPAMLVLYPTLLGLFVTGIVGIFIPAAGALLSLLLMLFAIAVNFGAGIWGLVKAYNNSKDNIVEFVLYLLIGPYQLYYWIKYWSVMKGVVGLMGVAFLGLFGSGLLMALFGAMAGP